MSRIDDLYSAIGKYSEGETDAEKIKQLGEMRGIYEAAKKEENEFAAKYKNLAEDYRKLIVNYPVKVDDAKEEKRTESEIEKDFSYYASEVLRKEKTEK